MAFLSPTPVNLKPTSLCYRSSLLCPSLRLYHRPSTQSIPLIQTSCSKSEGDPSQSSSNASTSPTQQKSTTKRPATSLTPQRLNNIQVFLERLGDTILDGQIHYTRLFSSRRLKDLPDNTKTGTRVVVLGTGWGAHSLVKIIDDFAVESVTVISPRNFFFFTPLLSATAVGTVEFRSIVEPIRKANPLIDYFEASAIDIDVNKRIVYCVSESDNPNGSNAEPEGTHKHGVNGKLLFEVPYDVLVIAVGETTATFNVPGAREYAYFLKEITDARNLRKNILDCLERASLPVWTREERRGLLRFIVVGGGPTGCEFAGELSDFVGNDLAPKYGDELVSDIEVILLQSGKTLLNQFESSLQKQALKSFKDRVNVKFDARVSQITKEFVILQTGEKMPYGLLVWAAGNATRDIVKKVMKKIDLPDTVRKLPVDPWFRVIGAKGIFALGDCSLMETEPLPATAQVAGQQGAFLGRLLSKVEIGSLDNFDQAPVLKDSGGKELHPFRFLSLGIMAYLGNDKAVVQMEATKDTNLTVGGRVAYVLWRSVYAVKQVDVRNRVLVLFDYFKSRVYGRDISQF